MRMFILAAAAFSLSIVSSACNRTPPPAAPSATDAPAIDFTGTWKNERGSELRVDSVVDGKLTGKFRSAVGRVDPSTWFPAVGFVHGDVVGFTVDFGSAGSVASWAGQLDGDKLMTQWHLARDVPDAEEHEKLWSAILAGADTFTR